MIKITLHAKQRRMLCVQKLKKTKTKKEEESKVSEMWVNAEQLKLYIYQSGPLCY